MLIPYFMAYLLHYFHNLKTKNDRQKPIVDLESTCSCCWIAEGGEDEKTPRPWVRWDGGKGWDEDDVVSLVAREEAADSGSEGYEGKE